MIMVGENDTEWQQLQLQRQADLSKIKNNMGPEVAINDQNSVTNSILFNQSQMKSIEKRMAGNNGMMMS